MKIEINDNFTIERSDLFDKYDHIKLKIPVIIEFLSKNYSCVESINFNKNVHFNFIVNNGKQPRIRTVEGSHEKSVFYPLEMQLTKSEENKLEFPHYIRDNNNKKHYYDLILDVRDNSEYDLLLTIKIDEYLLEYKIIFGIQNGKITHNSCNKINRKAWITITIITLSVILFILFNFYNTDVYEISGFRNTRVLFLIISIFISFHGLNYTSIFKIVFNRSRPIRYILTYPEIIVKANYLKFIKSKKSKYLSAIILFCTLFTVYKYTPIKLPINKNFSFFIDNNIINKHKIYRKDLMKVRIGLKNIDTIKPDDRIYIGSLTTEKTLLFFVKVVIKYSDFFYSENTNSPIEDSLKIDTVLANPRQKINSFIIATLQGQKKINYHRSYCHNNCITFCFANNCYHFKEFIDDYFNRKRELISYYFDKANNISKFTLIDSIENNIVNQFKDRYKVFKFNNRKTKIDAMEIMFIYNSLINFKNNDDAIEPFYKGSTIETFTKLIQFYTILKCTKDDLTINLLDYDKIGNDFEKYIKQDYSYNQKYRGFKAKDSKVLKMYAILISFIQSDKLQEYYISVFKQQIIEVLNFSTYYEAYELTNQRDKKLIEEQKRSIFLRLLYENYAIFNIPFDNDTKSIFQDYKNEIISDPDMKEKIKNIYLKSLQEDKKNIQLYLDYINKK